MTKALEEAFQAASKLSAAKQDELAAAIRAELEAEEAWDESLRESQGALSRLAEEALTDYRAGKTEPLDTKNE